MRPVWFWLAAVLLCSGCASAQLAVLPGNVVLASSEEHAPKVVVAQRYSYRGQQEVKGEMYGLRMDGPVHLFTCPGAGYVSVGTFDFRRNKVLLPEGGTVLGSGTSECNGGHCTWSVVVADLDIIYYEFIPAGGGKFMFAAYSESLRGRPEPPQAWIFEQLTFSQLKFVSDFRRRAMESYKVVQGGNG